MIDKILQKEFEDSIKVFHTNEESLLNQFKQLKDRFEENKIDTYSTKELIDFFSKFKALYEGIHEVNFVFFKGAISSLKDASIYCDLSIFYINRIQNIYLIPITYRINELNTQKSNKKANRSINIGTLSIVIGIIISFITHNNAITAQKETDVHFNKIEQEIKLIRKRDSLNVIKIESINNGALLLKDSKNKKIE